ncbi:MAG TPA: TIGR02556 family CRISPR-associated protein [Candidatus Saccharicenans sp.]|jgi:CRISPR-associated protein Csh1|nr:TIGR02556 family CRISPR-associated protein [Candidatus Saccharicenans sp.]HRD02901.1 TIGR02556 family CRISPR-associated protein [Candidatus Saccharicenans sp.]
MLAAIKQIGDLCDIDTPSKRPSEAEVIIIKINTGKQAYEGTEIEDFDSDKLALYMFKEGRSKGNVPSPFCPLTEASRTLKKIQAWLKYCTEIKDGNLSDSMPMINSALNMLQSQKDSIIADISRWSESIPKKTRKFLTLKINDKYPGQYQIFKKSIEDMDERRRKKSLSIGTCSICGSPDKEVSGTTDVFKFYTIDKPGFIAGGFKESDAWKNYPVCSDCKLSLERGKKFIEEHLNFKFYGLNYLLIPVLIIGDQALFKEIVTKLVGTKQNFSLKEDTKRRLTDDEREILDDLSSMNDTLAINILFLQRQQSAERILLLIEDVLPSRLKRLFDAKDYVDKIFNNDGNRGYTFGSLRCFFSKSDENKKTQDLNKYFLDIIDNIFRGQKISLQFLMKFFMSVIRRAIINDDHFGFRVSDGLKTLLYLQFLGLTNIKEENLMEKGLYEDFFERYGKALNTPAIRGIFLLGVLTQLLLNKQYAERDNKPFLKKLKGLKMDENDIKKLLPEVQNKLEEYDSFDRGKRLIASEASKYLLEAGNDWKMPADEINFYFACGMNLADEIAKITYQNNLK